MEGRGYRGKRGEGGVEGGLEFRVQNLKP